MVLSALMRTGWKGGIPSKPGVFSLARVSNFNEKREVEAHVIF